MSSFLWVEDFEGGQYREFSYRIFGHALGLVASDFFDNEIELKSFLKSKQIYLATNLAEGINFIANEAHLSAVDFVILDIDLALMGVDISEDEELIKPLLSKWYNYNPNDTNEEKAFNAACDELKRVAGYHLYIDLVVNRRFPRDRILFCSNHGGYLKAIQESFSGAKIEPPTVLTKADTGLANSVAEFYADEYSKLRRNIISICNELTEALRFGQAEFTLPKYLYASEDNFTASDGVYLLTILPLLLPPFLKDRREISLVYRQIVRTIAQEFDKVDYKNSAQFKRKLPYIRVLHNIRNWTSHDSKALNHLDESDVAYVVLLFLYLGFEMKSKIYEDLKSNLFEFAGMEVQIKPENLKENICNSLKSVSQRCNELPIEIQSEFSQASHFAEKVNMLSKNSCLTGGQHEKYIYQIFWHNIAFVDDSGNISPQSFYFDNNKFLYELARRIYVKSF